MDKRVLITGVGGFAGQYLAPELASAGYTVFGTTHVQGDAQADGRDKTFTADLRDYGQIESVVRAVRPTHVVHLAAIAFVGHGNVGEIYDTNIVGTRNLLQALSRLDQKPETVLLTSSANVYGNSMKGFLSEEDEVNPFNDYAVSKIAMEYMARQFYSTLNIVIARPFNYTGRGQSTQFLVPKIVSHFRQKAPVIELGNIDVSRDFTDVRVVTEYFRHLLERTGGMGETYNICTGQPISLDYILKACERLSGHQIEVRINPDFVRSNEIKTLAGNPTKLHAAVGDLNRYTIDDTLAWMLAD